MWHLALAYISIYGLVIDSNLYCLLDVPGNTLLLPAYYAKIFQRQFMTSDVMMVMEG